MSIPTATYRLQLRPGFGLDEAAALAYYLADLGVSHAYCSPYLRAVPGSTHGYDVVDPTVVNPELGGDDARAAFVRALARHGLGHVLDIVPNHMAIHTPENRWWWDVLENGPSSAFAPFFDIDWSAPEEKLRGQVLLPVLGDHYGRVLESGELVLERDGATFWTRYHEHAFPLSPASVGGLLTEALAEAGERSSDIGPEPVSGPGQGSPVRMEAGFLARALAALPEGTDRDVRRTRHEDLRVLRARMEAVLADSDLAGAVERVLDAVSRDADRLDALLEAQCYRISFWRAGTRELDYRRFFDIDSLAGVRAEDPEVLAATHVRILEWLGDGSLGGVRVDHPDGLRHPHAYFRGLRGSAPDAWIVAEKILESGETLREDWPVDGTTGYDALNDVGGLFVDPEGEAPLTELYHDLTGDDTPWHEVAHARRLHVLDEILPADLARVTQHFVDVCEGRRRYRDFTRWALRETLREVAACFPVYRTYVTEAGEAEDADRRVIGQAMAEARGRRSDLDPELFDLLEAILLGRAQGTDETELRMRFQQLTGPVTAKAIEDTAFYAWPRFAALNEVGGDPARFGVAPEDFHARCRRVAAAHPHTMTTLSTHDTKRSEDVRARLFLLSEIPERWGEAVLRWSRSAEAHRSDEGPDPSLEYLLWQTCVGAWPLPVERALEYARKAAREAKTRTSWRRPDEAYEEALERWVRGVLADEAIVADMGAFSGELVRTGRVTSLAQKLVQLTMPGVPDVYRGAELWDLSLVDPDNRRPVDFALRRELIEEVGRRTQSAGADGLLPVPPITGDPDEPGLAKLWLVRHALHLRRERPELFGREGAYEPLEARGPAADHVVGFARGGGAVTVVPRLVLGLEGRGGWHGTEVVLPAPRGAGSDGGWRNRLTGERWPAGPVALDDLLERFPAALLETV